MTPLVVGMSEKATDVARFLHCGRNDKERIIGKMHDNNRENGEIKFFG
jgi:hypothetical protein